MFIIIKHFSIKLFLPLLILLLLLIEFLYLKGINN